MVLGNGIEVFQISDTRLSLSLATYSEMFSYLQYSHISRPTTPHPQGEEIRNPKSEILNNIKILISKFKTFVLCFEHLNFLLFEFVSNLEFGASNFLVLRTRFRLFRFRSPLLTESRLYFFSSPY